MIDPNIALQVQPLKLDNPLESAGKALTLRQLMLQNQTAQQGIDDSSKLRSIYQQGASDPATLRDLLYKGGFPEKALALDKDVLANKETTAKIGQQNAQTEKYKNELRAQLSASVAGAPEDQRATIWPQVAQRWNALGLSADGAPPAPMEWNDNLLPHLEGMARAGWTPEQSANRIDEQRASQVGQPGTLNQPGDNQNWGNRSDGSPKGNGFLGPLKRPDGSVSTEISVGVNIGGKEVEIPTLVPTLSKDEVGYLLGGGRPTDAIVSKAVEFAKGRMAKGLPVFADNSESPAIKSANLAQPQGTPLTDDLPTPPTEAPSPTADQIHPLTTVTAPNGESSPKEMRARADLLDKKGTAVASKKADSLRARADSLETRILADAKDKAELVEIGDPTSPTGSRYVLKSEAAGQPGSKALVAPKTQITLKTSEELNRDFIGNEYRPTIQSANTAKSSNNQIQTLRNLDITGKSGWGADTQAKAASVLAAFGVKDAAKYAGDAQVFNATAGQKIFEVLASQKGTQTEGDANRAKQLFVNLSNTPDANKFLLDLGQATNNMAIKKADYYLTHRGEHKDDLGQLESEWFNASKDLSIWDDPVMKKWANKGAQSAPASDPNIDALIKKYTK